MKRFVSYVAAGMLAGAFAGPGLAMAQTGGANGAAAAPVIITSAGAPVSDLPMNQYKAFDDFRASHPDIARALARNPRLINDGQFQHQHPALHDFLSQNGDFAQDFSENPSDYILPARPHARPRLDQHSPSRTENAHTSANASAATNGGGADAGAGAGASTPANSGGAAPKGVPAASGGADEGNSSGGNM
jgi:hypothetical protein